MMNLSPKIYMFPRIIMGNCPASFFSKEESTYMDDLKPV
jgi:hypothetical protein